MVFGDFNEITHPDEKLGWTDRDIDQMRRFRDCLSACGLHDLGFVGSSFTWCNDRFGDQWTLIRLDRVVPNENWTTRFTKVQVHHISMSASNHCLLALFLRKRTPPKSAKKKKRFFFKAMWARDDRCKKVIEGAWDSLRPDDEIQEKINRCQGQLQWWNHRVFGNVNQMVKLKHDKLKHLKELNLLHETAEEIHSLKKEINECLTREEVMWNQRSRALWIKCGDHNTKFFHATANHRRKINRIEGLRGADDVWYDKPEDIEKEVFDYFTNIFSTASPSSFEASLESINLRITTDMNESLLKDFSEVEVRKALQQMHPTKAPDPDGMSPIFYQKYWEVVGDSVIKCVLQSLNSGCLLSGLNETYICIIPKVRCPQKITEFRPISLCNVIYKIVAKVLANRLKEIMLEVISESQSAFVPGRQITNNVIVAFEIMHSIDQRRKGKQGLMAIKLNMSKAFDRVEWGYLEAVMRRMGFQERWIELILMCVTTVSYFVLINGEPKGKIKPSRGLRQGDPISLYLFLLCSKGLSAMLKREEREGNIKGVSVCRGAPQLSHLLFVDDSIIFCRASIDVGLQVMKVLSDYEHESGQKLNMEKTSLFFSRNTNNDMKEAIKELFGA